MLTDDDMSNHAGKRDDHKHDEHFWRFAEVLELRHITKNGESEFKILSLSYEERMSR